MNNVWVFLVNSSCQKVADQGTDMRKGALAILPIVVQISFSSCYLPQDSIITLCTRTCACMSVRV